ncbi:MFS family permease [Pullulanibacillus pueri]|uniref:Uncharacterized protein n=1 Tax=Pullulanibacillus pueri TaxID=1437324 RepID=A0A8J2ZST2_9BACL|nr:hypothetical protein [Pullulanibacillus pueri]MBM7680378.1 MFS family permease [Pullulanibacillus pueri]GGH75363.1 hypothetical protein GCM10007096_04520 [Pullulanibacillus pueri]
MLSLLQTENTVLVVAEALIIARPVRKVNNHAAIVTGVLIFICGFAYLMFGTSLLLLMLMSFVATIGELIYVPVKQAYLGDLAPD